MQALLDNNNFFKTLFDVIPVIALIVDEEGRVHALNNTAKDLFGITGDDFYLKKGGDVFRCVYSELHPKGCGYSDFCEQCEVRNSAMEAIDGNSIVRTKGKLEVKNGDKNKLFNLLISSTPLNYDVKKYAIVIIEDISNIVELQGMLPICSSCKKIRDEEGYWKQVDEYIRNHSEADFTHGLCPECIKDLYPEFADKINSL